MRKYKYAKYLKQIRAFYNQWILNILLLYLLQQISLHFQKILIHTKMQIESYKLQPLLQSLIYPDFTTFSPSRHEIMKYSTWRIYLYNQLEGVVADRRDTKRTIEKYSTQFPNICISEERRNYYDFVYKPTEVTSKSFKDDARNDNIGHFICRMLYCQEESTWQNFVEVQTRILQGRLRRILRDGQHNDRELLMEIMKKMLAVFKQRDNYGYYNITNEEWDQMRDLITFNTFVSNRSKQRPKLYARLPFAQAEAGIRKRRSYIKSGYVYVATEPMIDIVLSNYSQFLRKKLQKLRPVVQDIIVEDSQNQMASFLISTIKQINEEGVQQTKFNGKFNLTLRMIDSLNRYFPPCMLNLNQHLKINRHLRHDGRRQLWVFFKACGMDVHENKEYFRRHLQGKVSVSEMKTHMYNIEHSYGLQGKKKNQAAWLCRNIITGAPPKKGQHHGCPFFHWRTEQLSEFLRKNYKVSQQKLKQILQQKQEKHFQVACGRLFQYSEVNSYDSSPIPAEITAKLGKAPYLYYEAAMELRQKKIKDKEAKQGKAMGEDKKSIQF